MISLKEIFVLSLFFIVLFYRGLVAKQYRKTLPRKKSASQDCFDSFENNATKIFYDCCVLFRLSVL